MTITTYTIEGMTCAHCVASVTEELSGVDGVSAVAVDLASGTVEVTSTRPLEGDVVREAVDEAGYELVGIP